MTPCRWRERTAPPVFSATSWSVFFINVDLHPTKNSLAREGVFDGNGSLSLSANADRVNLDPHRLCDLRRFGRLQLSGCVFAIGQQDDDLALNFFFDRLIVVQ